MTRRTQWVRRQHRGRSEQVHIGWNRFVLLASHMPRFDVERIPRFAFLTSLLPRLELEPPPVHRPRLPRSRVSQAVLQVRWGLLAIHLHGKPGLKWALLPP